MQCYDNSERALCNQTCKCNNESVYSTDQHLCLYENDGSHSCTSLSDCLDQSLTSAECNENCKCKNNYMYSTTKQKCLAKNNNKEDCTVVGDCFDQTTEMAECIFGKCTCISPCSFDSVSNLCLAPNNETVECHNLSHCQDQNSTRAQCDTTCKCIDNYIWSSVYNMCLLPNDDQNSCEDLYECIDQSSSGICSINCTCVENNTWATSNQRCECAEGHYESLLGTGNCTVCSAGTFQNQTGKLSCLNCYVGTYQEETGQMSCKDCPEGTYNPFEMGDSFADCLACPNGTYNPNNGSYECFLCEYGTFNNLTSQSSCTDCVPGQFQNETGQAFCYLCPSNTYNPYYGETNCTICPNHSSSEEGAAICTCERGTFYNSSILDEYCVVCYEFCTECYGRKHNCSSCIETGGISLVTVNDSYQECVCQENNGYFIYENLTSESQECKACHPLCLSCHSESMHDCDVCRDIPYIAALDNYTCDCLDGYFYDITQTNFSELCQKCHEFCEKCVDTKYTCSECIENDGVKLEGTTCGCSVARYFVYYNTSSLLEQCLECHPLCVSCFGLTQTECYSCDSTRGASFESPNSCLCSSHYYFNEDSIKCEVCNSLCNECFGSTSSECYSCNVLVSYAVEDIEYLCVADCETLGSYYASTDTCKHCDAECEKCWGGGSDDCYLCADKNKVMYGGDCIDECPSHYYAQDRLCYSCHSSCLECSNCTITSCSSCNSPLLLFEFQCVEVCPEKTYKNGSICAYCVKPCSTCTSELSCITCAKSFYKISGTTSCVKGEKCPKGTYADDNTGQCESCDITCLTCSGGTSSDCIICNYALGYSKSTTDIGECYLLVCSEGKYVFIDSSLQKAICANCHDSCATCDNEGKEYCITCKANYQVVDSPVANHQSCQSCADLNSGFTMKSDGTCQEICGDGKNYGILECDDGNKISGDGCSSSCEVETGYECTHEYAGIDSCLDIVAPSAVLKVKTGNQLIVTFSEKVVSKLDNLNLQSSMKVILEGVTSSSCNFTWSISDTFSASKVFTKLNISTVVNCNLKGKGVEQFIVTFTKPCYITDPTGNVLSTPEVQEDALRYAYISQSEKEAIESSGSAFSSSSLITFGLAIGMVAFQSVAISSFWAFMNLLQMISYLPMINVELPSNMELFLTQYMTAKQLTIPFDMLPDCIPNPLSWLTDFLTQPLNDHFEVCGYKSLSFLYNFADELFTWLLIFLLYLLLAILGKFFSREKCEVIHRWKEEYEYNGIFRILLECFLNMNFCACLNIWMLDISTTANVISLFGAALAFYVSMLFMQKCMKLVETSEKHLKSEAFTKQFGTLVEDLKISSILGRQFYPIFGQFFLYDL